MKKLDITPITDAAEFPVKKGTLQFLQDAYGDLFTAFLISFIPNYNPNTVYILWGINNSGSGSTYLLSTGAVFYQGEIFQVDATNFTATGSNTAIFSIGITQYTTDADPVTLTDMSVHNMHNIRKVYVNQGTSGSGIADYSQGARVQLIVPAQLNLTAPTSGDKPGGGTFDGNLLQLIGDYPDIQLYVAPAANQFPILDVGEVHVGDVGGGGVDIAVVFTVGNVGTTNYKVCGEIFSGGPNTRQDSVVTWSVRNKTATGCTIHFEEYSPGVQNITFGWVIVKKG